MLIETRNIRETLSLYLGELAMKKADYEEKILNKMKKRGISGSAIVPNLVADQEWTSTLSHMEKELRGQMRGMLCHSL